MQGEPSSAVKIGVPARITLDLQQGSQLGGWGHMGVAPCQGLDKVSDLRLLLRQGLYHLSDVQ